MNGKWRVPALFALALSALGAASCGGGGGGSQSPVPIVSSTPLPRSSQTPSPSPTTSPSIAPTATASPSPSGSPTQAPNTQQILIVNPSANDVLTFAANASGDAAPLASVNGSNTTLSNPFACALDTAGDVYVANQGANQALRFTSTGNPAPAETFTDTTAGVAIYGLAVNRTGTFALYASSRPTGTIDVFNSGGSLQGSIAGAATTLNAPTAMAADRSGNLYVVDGAAVKIFANSAAGGNIAPTVTISGAATTLNAPTSIALDAKGDILVGDGASVKIFAAGSSGDAAPATVISGSATGLQNVSGVAVDGTGGIWASDSAANAMYRFASTANGNAAPIVTIAGTNTTLSGPVCVRLGVAI